LLVDKLNSDWFRPVRTAGILNKKLKQAGDPLPNLQTLDKIQRKKVVQYSLQF
jgi:hypothetical protein